MNTSTASYFISIPSTLRDIFRIFFPLHIETKLTAVYSVSHGVVSISEKLERKLFTVDPTK
jgi:hypothetical protein